MVAKKKKTKVKKTKADAASATEADGRAAAAANADPVPVNDSAAEEPAGLSARERRAVEEAEYQVAAGTFGQVCMRGVHMRAGVQQFNSTWYARQMSQRPLKLGGVEWDECEHSCAADMHRGPLVDPWLCVCIRLGLVPTCDHHAGRGYPCLATYSAWFTTPRAGSHGGAAPASRGGARGGRGCAARAHGADDGAARGAGVTGGSVESHRRGPQHGHCYAAELQRARQHDVGLSLRYARGNEHPSSGRRHDVCPNHAQAVRATRV